MANVIDVDAAITRLSALLGITYDEARVMVETGKVIFSVPVTDSSITVNTTLADTGVYPANIDTDDMTAVTKIRQQTTAANTAYTIHTVTSGKTFYLKALSMNADNAAYCRFGADLTGNALVSTRNVSDEITWTCAADTPMMMIFPVPVKYDAGDNLQFMQQGAGNMFVTINGWEE